ncbi:MAG: glycosyltransferase family 39 protein [bacterium]|nr:glycosyltransferase family 39 protein [bacterium]
MAQITLQQWYREHRTEVLVFGIVIFFHLTALAGLYMYGVDVPVLGSDARGYINIAENIKDHGAFSSSVVEPFIPDSKRTPGYTFFIATLLSLFGFIVSVSIAQAVLSGFTGILVFRIARRYFSINLSMAIALIYGLHPTSLFLSSVLLSETLFTFLFLLSIYIFLRGEFRSVWSAALLGLATLVRPIGQVLVIGFLLSLIRDWKRALLFFGVFILVLSPWMIRNQIHFGSSQLSLISTINAFSYHTALFKAYKDDTSHKDALDILKSELEVPYDDIDIGSAHHLSSAVKKELFEDPVSFSLFYVVKTAPFFFADGTYDVALKSGLVSTDAPNITSALLRGDWSGIIGALRDQGVLGLVSVFEMIFWGLLFIGMVISLLYAYRESRYRSDIVYFIVIIVLAAVATGTVANARLRFPFEPLMFISAGLGFRFLKMSIKKGSL